MGQREAALALRARGLPPAAKLTLACLALYTDHRGRGAYPSVTTLAAHADLDRRNVQRSLRTLEAEGWIYEFPAINETGRVYHLNTERLDALADEGGRQYAAGGRQYAAPYRQTGVEDQPLAEQGGGNTPRGGGNTPPLTPESAQGGRQYAALGGGNTPPESKTGNTKNQKNPTPPIPPAPSPAPPAGRVRATRQQFDQWWEIWGKKVAKKDAQRAWAKVDNDDVSAIMDDTRARNVAGYFQREKVLHPATYLNGERWTDDRRTYSEKDRRLPTTRAERDKQARDEWLRDELAAIAEREATPGQPTDDVGRRGPTGQRERIFEGIWREEKGQ